MNECTNSCVSDIDSKGWSILNEPEPLDNEPATKVAPSPLTLKYGVPAALATYKAQSDVFVPPYTSGP